MTPALDALVIKLGRAMEANRPPGVRLVHARCGRRRGFLSNSDARAYEAGWYSFRDGAPMPNEPGPREDGWKDARAEASEAAYQLRHGCTAVRVRDLETGRVGVVL